MEPQTNTNPSGPPPDLTATPTSKHASQLLKYLAVLAVAVIAAGAVYVWQNTKVSNLDKQVSALKDEIKGLKKPADTKSAASGGVSSTWKSFSSSTGQFSLQYNPEWEAKHCDISDWQNDKLIDLLDFSVETTGGLCALHGFRDVQVEVSKNSELKRLDKPDTDNFRNTTENISVTVDGVVGHKYAGVAANPTYAGPRAGTKYILYVFSTNAKVYTLRYVQSPDDSDRSDDFNQMITKTLRFSAS